MFTVQKSSLAHLYQAVVLLLIVSHAGSTALAATEHVLYAFRGGPDGNGPFAGVIADASGNLYGTTVGGGTGCAGGCGTVFEIFAPSTAGGAWTEAVLYSFRGQFAGDGQVSETSLVFDSAGNLYGTTLGGGSSANCGTVGCGTVFELSPPSFSGGPWIETVLYSFQSGTDGFGPLSSLLFDLAGNLYGTTLEGGGTGCGGIGCGTIFELSPPAATGGAWTETVIYRFQGGRDGAGPLGNLAIDAKSNLYGVTGGNGKCNSCGTSFKLTPPAVSGGTWSKHVLHYFQSGSSDGQSPAAGPKLHQGLYGTTEFGGQLGQGTVYQLASGTGGPTETVLYNFGSNTADMQPAAGVVFDLAGNLYGTNTGGTALTGTVFQLQPPSQSGGDWTETVLHTFTDGPDGGWPTGTLMRGKLAFYGTTFAGGDSICNCGVVFAVTR